MIKIIKEDYEDNDDILEINPYIDRLGAPSEYDFVETDNDADDGSVSVESLNRLSNKFFHEDVDSSSMVVLDTEESYNEFKKVHDYVSKSPSTPVDMSGYYIGETNGADLYKGSFGEVLYIYGSQLDELWMTRDTASKILSELNK
jgi:hypothetical protein